MSAQTTAIRHLLGDVSRLLDELDERERTTTRVDYGAAAPPPGVTRALVQPAPEPDPALGEAS